MLSTLRILYRPFYRTRPIYSVVTSVLLISSAIGTVLLDLRFNTWRGIFWTAIQSKNYIIFHHQLWVFTVLAFVSIGLYTFTTYLAQMYALHWRTALTGVLVPWWIGSTEGNKSEHTTDNPDQRLQQDLADFVSRFPTLFIGLLSALTTIILFMPLLSSLSHQISTIHPWALPLLALGFSSLSWASMAVFRNIPKLEQQNQSTEADYRYELVHLRDGGPYEETRIRSVYSLLFNNHKRLFNAYKVFNIFSNTYFQTAIILPILFIVPAYFSGAIAFGLIMQSLDCFNKITTSFSWLLDNFLTICQYKATLTRLTEFMRSIAYGA